MDPLGPLSRVGKAGIGQAGHRDSNTTDHHSVGAATGIGQAGHRTELEARRPSRIEEEIEETGEVEEDKDGKIPSLEVTEYERQGDPFSSVENEWSEENSKTTDEDEWGVPWE